jgi:hypothetical protein
MTASEVAHRLIDGLDIPDGTVVTFPRPQEAGTTWPLLTAANAWGTHFLRCFFCCIGDRYTQDRFCETGRELIVAMLDEMDGRP